MQGSALDWLAVGGTWLASLGTTVGILYALRQGRRQRSAELEHIRTEQAELISAWPGPGELVYLSNGSRQLAYQVMVIQVLRQGAGPHRGEEINLSQTFESPTFVVLDFLQPGTSQLEVDFFFDGGMFRHPGLEIAFTDRQGQHWIRRVDGTLEQIRQSPIDHYGVSRPVSYRSATSVLLP